jgi:hypothetical protein
MAAAGKKNGELLTLAERWGMYCLRRIVKSNINNTWLGERLGSSFFAQRRTDYRISYLFC